MNLHQETNTGLGPAKFPGSWEEQMQNSPVRTGMQICKKEKKKDLYKNIYRSSAHNSSKLKTTPQMIYI